MNHNNANTSNRNIDRSFCSLDRPLLLTAHVRRVDQSCWLIC